MRSDFRWTSLAAACAFASLSTAATAAAPVVAEHWSAFSDFSSQTTTFTLDFDRAFSSADGDQVQFWLSFGIGDPYALAFDVLTGAKPAESERLLEFPSYGAPGAAHVVAVKPDPYVGPNPSAGGWGQILGDITFTEAGDVLQFSVPFSLLGTPPANRPFFYTFASYYRGEGDGRLTAGYSGLVFDPSTPIPEPSTWAMLALGMVAMTAVARRRRG
jgi:hypothetical protein